MYKIARLRYKEIIVCFARIAMKMNSWLGSYQTLGKLI